jgi:moderate conductance mechanosensitive channel
MIAVLIPRNLLPDGERLAEMGIRLLFTLAAALLLWQLSLLLIGRVERWLSTNIRHDAQREQRARTLGSIFRNLAAVIVFSGAAIHGLEVLGWNVGPILAGAGILGVALGFGAQTLVRDLIAGLSILVENQFAVGDVIDINGSPATVEALSLRRTQLRDFNGYVLFVPNGEMKIVINRSRGWNRVVVDVPVDVNEDIDRVLAACRQAADSMNRDPAWADRLLEPVQVWGVEALAGHEAIVRLVVRGRPGGDVAQAARELRRRIHLAFVQAGFGGRRQVAILSAGPTATGAPMPPAIVEESGAEHGSQGTSAPAATGEGPWR